MGLTTALFAWTQFAGRESIITFFWKMATTKVLWGSGTHLVARTTPVISRTVPVRFATPAVTTPRMTTATTGSTRLGCEVDTDRNHDSIHRPLVRVDRINMQKFQQAGILNRPTSET